MTVLQIIQMMMLFRYREKNQNCRNTDEPRNNGCLGTKKFDILQASLCYYQYKMKKNSHEERKISYPIKPDFHFLGQH